MKLVAISDTHHQHYYLRLPKADMLIHAGDFSFRGERIEQILVVEWIRRQAKKYKYVVFIAGNHDINFMKGRHQLPENVHHLQDSGVTIEGIHFYGSPYTPRFGDWGFGEPDEQLAKRFEHIPKKTQVLITHGPAYSILDKNKHGQLCGSMSLYQKLKRLPNLKHHIFGHIHEGYGQDQIDDIKFHNVSVLDENYKIKNKPTLIELAKSGDV